LILLPQLRFYLDKRKKKSSNITGLVLGFDSIILSVCEMRFALSGITTECISLSFHRPPFYGVFHALNFYLQKAIGAPDYLI